MSESSVIFDLGEGEYNYNKEKFIVLYVIIEDIFNA